MTTERKTTPIPVRMPEVLYDRVVHAASINGRSNNAEMVDRLHESFRRENTLAELLLEGLGLEKYQRIISTTEENDARRLFLFLDNIPVSRIYLAARKDSTFGAIMVVLIQSGPLTLFMDHAHFNRATPESHEIVMDVLANIERLDLGRVTSTADDFVPDTREMSDYEAIDCYLSHVPFRKQGDLKTLVDLLADAP